MYVLAATLVLTSIMSVIVSIAVWLDKGVPTRFTAALAVVAPLAALWSAYAAGHFAGLWL